MRHKNLKGHSAVCVGLTAAILSSFFQTAWAEKARRAGRKSQPATIPHTSPDITATVGQPKSPVAQAPPNDAPLKPFFLPAAPRSRMRACGLKWQDVKISGRAGDETWREFATKCLAQRDDAEKKSRP